MGGRGVIAGEGGDNDGERGAEGMREGGTHLEESDGFGDDVAACAVDDGVEVGAGWGKHLFELSRRRGT